MVTCKVSGKAASKLVSKAATKLASNAKRMS